VAELHRPAALILHSGYPSLVPVARQAYPWLPVSWIMKDRFECAERLSGLPVPLMCVHGAEDRTVPPALGQALFEASPVPSEDKLWWLIAGADHGDVPYVDLAGWSERVRSFLERRAIGD
jgi:fermentation-respiration switch protein FrsA (DUF1100 family)